MSYQRLLLATVGGCLLFALALWQGWGKWSLMHGGKPQRLIDDPEFKVKADFLLSLMQLNGQRPYTLKEMEVLRHFIQSKGTEVSERVLRGEALYVLALSPDPKQQAEAVRFAIERLKDPAWFVRSNALYVLTKLRVKEAVPHILPLLNDPKPEVREDARKALQRLGYRVP